MIDEIERQERVTDQMLTGHSILRDRYRRRERALNLAVLAASLAILVISFLASDWIDGARNVVGVLAAIVFFAALVEARVDLRGRAARHKDAGVRLAALKARYKALPADLNTVPSAELEELIEEYGRVSNSITPIPDRNFHGLKAAHLRKITLSRMIDKSPGTPVWLMRLHVLWDGLVSSSAAASDHAEGDESGDRS